MSGIYEQLLILAEIMVFNENKTDGNYLMSNFSGNRVFEWKFN